MLQVDSLSAQISYYEQQLELEQDKFSVASIHHQEIIANLNEQKRLLLNTIEILNKEIVRLKRGKKFATLFGIITTGAAIYLSSIK